LYVVLDRMNSENISVELTSSYKATDPEKNINNEKEVQLNIGDYWSSFYIYFKSLVILTVLFVVVWFFSIFTPKTTEIIILVFKITQIILGVIVIVKAGKFAYLVTKKSSYKFIGLWLLFPIPFLNYVILYNYMNVLRKRISQ